MIMRGCGGVVLGFAIVSTAAFITGFATLYWYQNSMVHFGLWRFCDAVTCGWNAIYSFSFMLAVRALMCIGLGSSAVALASNLGWVARTEEEGQRSGCRVAQSFYTFAGVCGCISILVFPLQIRYYYNEHGINNFGYSFWCAVAGSGALLLLGSISSCVTKQWLNTVGAVRVVEVQNYAGTATVQAPTIHAVGSQRYPTQYPMPHNPYTGQPVSYPPGPPATYNNPAYRAEAPPPAYGFAGNLTQGSQIEKR